MRAATIGGILLIAFGVVVLALGLTYPDSKTIVDLGDLKAKVTDHKRVPNWVGAAALAGGVVLIGAAGLTQAGRARR